jgi:multidrug efflux pump subunit AcrA (membrane-fusion protein)
MKNIFIYLTLVFFLFPGCNSKKVSIITYELKRSDYLDAIEVTGTIQAVNNVLLIAPGISATNLLKITYLAEDGAHVRKGDTICKFEVPSSLSSNLESFTTSLENLEGDLKKLEANNAMQLALLKAQVETNKAQIAIKKLDSIQIKFAPEVKQRLLAIEMEKADIEKMKLQKKFAAQKRINNSELIQMRSRIMIQKNRIKMIENQINLLSLVAPVNGIVMHVENYRLDGSTFTIGKIEEGISTISGMSVLQIPEMKDMQVSVEVPEDDYKRIETGQKVLIRVEASKNLITSGNIKRKTLQRKNAQEKTAIKTYEVIIKVDSCHSKMTPGLSAMCRIIVKQVKDTIVVPTSAIIEKDSSKFIYVADGDKFIPVAVETGISSSSKSIISKGLAGNETIALIEPPHNLIRKEVNSKEDSSADSRPVKKDTVLSLKSEAKSRKLQVERK